MTISGGCLCGAMRYVADAPPQYAGYCFCADCRKASGSGFIPFMGFAGATVHITGRVVTHTLKHKDGRQSDRNFCATCGGLVFGGILGQSEQHTIYAGSLDDPAHFKPTIAIFNRDRPNWVILPEGLKVFEAMPQS